MVALECFLILYVPKNCTVRTEFNFITKCLDMVLVLIIVKHGPISQFVILGDLSD